MLNPIARAAAPASPLRGTRRPGVRSGGTWAAALLVLLLSVRPAHALPKFAREYHVGCETCHSIPPRLNQFGLAFQANYFNWPSGKPPVKHESLKAIPISGIAAANLTDNRTTGKTTAQFSDLLLFLADGFTLNGQKRGGYFFNVDAYTSSQQPNGALFNAFAALPVAGKRGQFAVTLGQLTPMMFQYDPINRLLDFSPAAMSDVVAAPVKGGAAAGGGSAGGGGGGYAPIRRALAPDVDLLRAAANASDFSFTTSMPGVRMDWFDNRGKGTADGTYASAGVAFRGRLALNDDAAVHGADGVYATAFHRWEWKTVGGFAFKNADRHLEGLIGTYSPVTDLYLLGIGAIGHDAFGPTRRLSLEAEYVLNPRLALTGRLEVLGGHNNDVAPAGAITYYPTRWRFFRLTAETIQRKGNRALILFARGQF